MGAEIKYMTGWNSNVEHLEIDLFGVLKGINFIR